MPPTYSGNAANLTLDARAGGCSCEKIPQSGGSLEYMRAVNLMPGRFLRLRGPFGPLQGMGVDAPLSFSLAKADNGTDITVNFAAGNNSNAYFAQV
jgi:hypothetical protein